MKEYLDAPLGLPRRDGLSANRDKARIRMSMQSHEKLTKYMTRMVNAYQTWYSEFKDLVEEQRIPTIGAIGTIRMEGEIWYEAQGRLEVMRKVATQGNLEPINGRN